MAKNPGNALSDANVTFSKLRALATLVQESFSSKLFFNALAILVQESFSSNLPSQRN